jgi:phosphohistidine phosphatase
MARELLLLRHAKSAWPDGVADFSRPLKKRGKKAARKMGEWLLAQQLCPDWIITSPAERASQTAVKLCKGLQLKKSHVLHVDNRIYEADIETLKAVLADCPAFPQRVLLVGHNPGLDALLKDLVAGIVPDDDGKLMATTTLARILMPDEWHHLKTHCGKLLSLTRASQLDAPHIKLRF